MVSTKKQASDNKRFKRNNQFFVNYRWLGGITQIGIPYDSIKVKLDSQLSKENLGFTKRNS